MTGEAKGVTEKWVESKGAKYPYGYDKGGRLKDFFGVKGIPHAVLIDATGTVVWSGHPGGLTADVVEEHLGGALEKPMWKWPSSAKKVRQAIEKRQFAKAIEEARGLGEEGETILAALQRMVAGKIAGLKAAAEAGDWLEVETTGGTLVKELSGLPEADEAKSLVDRLEGDKEAQAVLAAQKDVRKLMDGKIKKGDKPRIEKKLKEIKADFPDTAAARDADKALVDLRKI